MWLQKSSMIITDKILNYFYSESGIVRSELLI